MPKYEVDVGGKTYEVDAPDPNTAWQWANYTHNQAPAPEAKPAPFSLSDTALSAAQSALGATKSTIEGVTGAGSAPGEYLTNLQKKLGEKLTPERQAEIQRRAELEKKAAETGRPMEEIAAGLGGVKEAPVQTFAQAVGSSAPTVLAGMGVTALGATLGAPVALAAGVGIAAKYLLGAIQGAGEVKGTIYDTVKNKLMENNVPEADAKRQALAAQDYLGKNWDTIAEGLGLGAVAGGTGMETELLKKFSKPVAKQIAAKEAAKAAEKNAVVEFGKAVGKEAFTEGAQGGQGQYAENVALTREGYITDALKGVYGAAARDAAMGAIGGGGIHAIAGGPSEVAKPTPKAEETPTAPPEAAPAPLAPADLSGLSYVELVKAREGIKQLPQTTETRAEIKRINDEIIAAHEKEIETIRADKKQEEIARKRFPGLAEEPTQQALFPEEELVLPKPAEERAPKPLTTARQVMNRRQRDEEAAQIAAEAAQKEQERKGGQYRLPLRSVPEGKDVRRDLPIPARPTEITQQDLEDIGVPLRTSQKWMEQNVIGKTPAEIQVLVGNNPDLLLGTGARAQILKYLTAPVPEGFVEEPNVAPITQTNKPKPSVEPRGGQPSVGVSGEPAGANVVQPRPRVPTAPRAPAAPVGLGLAPAGQPTGTGTNVAGAQPTAVTSVAPDVESIPSFPVGPSRITPKAIAKDKPVYHETNTTGLDDLLRYDGQFEYSGSFVSDNADLALGQGGNTGVFIEFRPNSISGKVSPKIGTSPETGQEYKTDVIAPKAVNAVTVKAGTKFNPRPVTRRILAAEFDKTTLPDGSVQYVRKGASPSLALPITWSSNAPTTTTAPTAPVTPAAPAAGSTVAAKPTPKAPPAKKVEAPAPAKPAEAVETETAEEEAARKAEADEIKRRLEEVERKLQERPAPKAAATAPKAEKAEPKELPAKLREPVGTSEFGMEEGEKEILRGPQGMLFPMSKREEIEYAERKERGEKEPVEEPTKPQMVPRDARQGRLDLQPRKEEPKIPEWATKFDTPTSIAVFANDEIALVRGHNLSGQYVYVGSTRNGTYTRTDIEKYTGTLFNDKQLAILRDERAKAVFAESKKFAKNPDGPFTGAKTNVAKSDSVDQRYADYLHGLMQELGLGDVRIFLVSPDDMAAPDAVEKYKLYKDYASVKTAGQDSNEEGSKRTYGPERRDFYISFKPGMSENKTLEVISHELGHAIQNIAYDNAAPEVKKAIRDEYEQWLASTKGKTSRELVQMLRNRETADTQMLSMREKQPASELSSYWTSFNEWFADNVSRWASTNEKPLKVTEKFFAKVAQMMRDLVAVVTGRKYPPAKTVADFLNKMGPDDAKLWLIGKDEPAQPSTRAEFSVNPSTEALIDSMGPLDAQTKSALGKLIAGVKDTPDIDYVTKARTQVADIGATIEKRLSERFDGAVRDSMGKLNPMGLYRQAQDYTKMLLEYFQTGTLYKDPATGLWKSGIGEGVRPPAEVYALIDKYAEKNGYSRDRATQIASRVLEGVRLDEMRRSNKTGLTNFAIHLKDNEIDQLVREYKADADLQEMSKLMDEARIAMVDNMVKAGRLSKEEGTKWKEVVGYVPFDRIEDFATNFNKTKKISGKGLAQLGKLPELVGSVDRPVGNVFDNYINTLGWMVGQTMKADATTTTLRSLEDLGYANFLGRSTQNKPNVVGAYVDGEMMYWSVPSKYDVMAFKDLNPPKAGWLRNMGAFSNVLRKTVTVLPPFALKQVTDDVQRAILTSGVKNPGALIWMSLTNFPKLAFAELRGIQHPDVKEFGRLGLTGEYDFEAGKPATSLLKDLGYKKRGRFETILHRLDGITRASDLAVRKAIYDQTMKETQDAVLAQTRAREFINFRRRGASDFVGAMVTTIPFFNAYIQGMDVLYRAASGKDSSASVDRAQARRMFWSRAATVMMLSSLYALGKDDEDKDYQEMDLRTRDGNWILPGGYKIPVPGELGAIFKVIPERVVEYMRRQGTPEEQEAFEAVRTTLSYMYEQYLGRAVPIPQAIKPVMEAWANKSFLTGRDLEGYHHKAMDPSMRTTEQTSELAKAIAVFSRDQVGAEVSPIMIDNALRGYFGSSAALLTMVTDSLLNPTRVDRPLHKYALLSNYLYDPVGTRRMTEFYEEREKVGKANTTLNELMKTDLDRAEKYADEHANELMMESAINSTLEQLERTRAYRKYLNSVEGANDMSKDEREAQLKEIKQMEIEFVGWVREAKAELRKAQ